MSEETTDEALQKAKDFADNVPKMYYGAHEIVNVETEENGVKRVEIKFATPKPTGEFTEVKDEEGVVTQVSVDDLGEKFSIPEWELNVCSATEPCSEQEHLSELLNRRSNYVVGKMLDLFDELDMRVEDFTFCTQKLIQSNVMKEENAMLKAFGVNEADEIRHSHWNNMLQS